jgi:hypothetical protein
MEAINKELAHDFNRWKRPASRYPYRFDVVFDCSVIYRRPSLKAIIDDD